MEQLEKNARLIAAHILERDGHSVAVGSRLFEDLCELAKSLLAPPARPWSFCEPQPEE